MDQTPMKNFGVTPMTIRNETRDHSSESFAIHRKLKKSQAYTWL